LLAATLVRASKLNDLQTGVFFRLTCLDQTGAGIIYHSSLCSSFAGQEEKVRHRQLDLLYTVTE